MVLAFVHHKINRLEIQEEIDFSLSSKERAGESRRGENKKKTEKFPAHLVLGR